jgi:microcystin-dependent protein
MAEYYIAQIMMTGFPFAQKTFAQCNGQTLSIQQNQALFALLGVMYGGNGTTNFNLPDFRGRIPVGGGVSSADPSWRPAPYVIGQVGGTENVTLLTSQLPMHAHAFNANTTAGTTATPTGGVFAQAVIQGGSNTEPIYTTGGNLVPLANGTVGPAGGNQPHTNVQPSSVINFNIALSGIWPSRN